jgi:carbonic anhydrase
MKKNLFSFRLAFAILLFYPFFLKAEPDSGMTPKKALQQLMNGNGRYIIDKLEHPNRTLERRQSLSAKQEPFAIIIGCSDSRVSPEIVFDQGLGDLFVVRIAGNVLGPIELSSAQYSAEYLHSSLIFVLGHENCGAVNAVLNHQTKDIEPIAKNIETAIHNNKINFSNNALENAIKANVRWVVQELRKNELIANLIKEKKIEVVGGYYHLDTGKVELCCDIQ